jgi:hypothetical protein
MLSHVPANSAGNHESAAAESDARPAQADHKVAYLLPALTNRSCGPSSSTRPRVEDHHTVGGDGLCEAVRDHDRRTAVQDLPGGRLDA